MRDFKRAIAVFLTAAIAALMLPFAVSCSKFALESLEIEMGEFADIAEYASGEISLTAKDGVVVVYGNTVIYGNEAGVTNVTVRNGINESNLEVSVVYADVDLNISCNGKPYSTVLGTILDFTADIGFYADPSTEIVWYLDGKKAGVGKNFSFELGAYKKYEVSAEAAGQKKTMTAVCYRPFETPPAAEIDGDKFALNDEITLSTSTDCGDAEVIWYVDNAECGRGKSMSFTAEQTGEHTAFALVNGEQTNEVSFSVIGAPQNVVCDFDSQFPDIFLRWQGANTDYEVTIGDKTYDASSNRFDGNSFCLNELIDLQKPTPITVRCVEADEETTVTSPKLASAELRYLESDFYHINRYMTSDEEVYNIVECAMTFRPEQGKKIALELYMGYESDMTPGLLLCKAWLRTEQTGKYKLKASGSSDKGGKLAFSIECFTPNEPSDSGASTGYTFQSLLTPHFESGYDEFPIDDRPEWEVSTSEQLYYVVQNGFCPVPAVGSAAEKVYDKAKSVLGQILSNEMSDVQKVRAIFEWIMWNNVYDSQSASETDVEKSVLSPAYYLEGVFISGHAVCDGIAKSMSLLCNMVGIPCVRVVGFVVQNTAERHAWNKVMIGGKWYIVDATWSDPVITMGKSSYEGALHTYFLLSDGEAPSHKASYPDLDPSADFVYNWYERSETGSRYVKDGKIEELSKALMNALAEETYEVRVGDDVTERDFFTAEIKLSEKAEYYFKMNLSYVNEVVYQVVKSDSFVKFENGILLVMIKK